jgi:23S rRNA (uracil1939-C5)-methyltransferase
LLVKIEKLIYGGMGFGRVDGKAIFVSGGVPDDLLEVTVVSDKRTFAEAKIERIIKPSPERTGPKCTVFGKCGGCQWQHFNYPLQLKAKEQILTETLLRIGGFKELNIEPIVPSPNEYGYRDRVTLSAWLEDGNFRLGYHEKEELSRVPISGCPIASEEINSEIKNLNEFFLRDEYDSLPFNRINIVSDGKRAYVTFYCITNGPEGYVYSGSKKDHELNEAFKCLGFQDHGEHVFQFESLGLNFYSVPSVFIQANRRINEQLVSTVLDWAKLQGNEEVLDLFSGVGNFSLHLAKSARKVLGVDISKMGVSLARRNSKANMIGNVRFVCSSVASFLRNNFHRRAKFDLVILDPPREGARDILEDLLKLSPKRMIYVSCNPSTLARDLKSLTEKDYKLEKICPFDMFPQTFHIESVASLRKFDS